MTENKTPLTFRFFVPQESGLLDVCQARHFQLAQLDAGSDPRDGHVLRDDRITLQVGIKTDILLLPGCQVS